MIDDTWDNHIDQLISRLNSACYAVRAVKPMLSRKVLRVLYFPYVHSIISYGIIFWSNTPNSIKIFRMQNQNFKNYDKFEENGFMSKTI